LALRLLVLLALVAGCAARAPIVPAALDRGFAPATFELAEVPFFPQQDTQCGPASLAAVLAYAGVDVTAEALRPEVYLPERQGALTLELAAAVRRRARIPYQVPPDLAALLAELRAGRPVLVLQNLGLERTPVWHFAVVVGYAADADTLLLRSGETARLRADAYNFLRTWTLAGRWALVALRPGELPAADDAGGYLRAVAAAEATNPQTDALAAYEAAVRRWPGNDTARFGLANASRRAGDTERAIALYLDLVVQSPDQIAARNNLADALSAVGCPELALRVIEAALARTPASHPLHAILQQTRAEIAAALRSSGEAQPRACARWQQAPGIGDAAAGNPPPRRPPG
jgi:tetratricopeptide (TPR) repeat protein